MKKHTHIIYRKKWEGNKKKSKMTVKMEQPLVACMCGSFCSDLGQLEKERDYYKCGAIFVDGFYRFQL